MSDMAAAAAASRLLLLPPPLCCTHGLAVGARRADARRCGPDQGRAHLQGALSSLPAPAEPLNVEAMAA